MDAATARPQVALHCHSTAGWALPGLASPGIAPLSDAGAWEPSSRGTPCPQSWVPLFMTSSSRGHHRHSVLKEPWQTISFWQPDNHVPSSTLAKKQDSASGQTKGGQCRKQPCQCHRSFPQNQGLNHQLEQVNVLTLHGRLSGAFCHTFFWKGV